MRQSQPQPGQLDHWPEGRPEQAELPDLFRSLLQHSPVVLIVATAPDAMIAVATELTAEAIGRPLAALIGQPAEAHPARLGLTRPNENAGTAPESLPLARAVRAGETIRDELWWLRRADGETRIVRCSAEPIRDEAGTIRWGVLTWRDVADEPAVRAEQMLALKDTTLRVASHRMRSSLSLVAALMRTHASAAPPPARRQLLSAAARTVALGQLHRDVLHDGDGSRLDMGRYLTRIARGLETAVAEADRPVSVAVEAAAAPMSAEIATWLGLLTVELVVAGRAMAGRSGEPAEIEIALRADGDGVALQVTDLGATLPADFDSARAAGPSTRLIHALVAQLDGTLTIERPARGVRFTVALPPVGGANAPTTQS